MAPPARLTPVPTEIIDAFRAVSPTLEDFARQHDLLIERYRRGKAAWELRFARRAGGGAVVTISYRERTGHVLDVSITWWVDDREGRTRRLRSEKVGVYDRRTAPSELRQRLGARAGAASPRQPAPLETPPDRTRRGPGQVEEDFAAAPQNPPSQRPRRGARGEELVDPPFGENPAGEYDHPRGSGLDHPLPSNGRGGPPRGPQRVWAARQ